jgi:hypothetical protein
LAPSNPEKGPENVRGFFQQTTRTGRRLFFELVVSDNVNMLFLYQLLYRSFIIAGIPAGEAAACGETSGNRYDFCSKPCTPADLFETQGHMGGVEGGYTVHDIIPS